MHSHKSSHVAVNNFPQAAVHLSSLQGRLHANSLREDVNVYSRVHVAAHVTLPAGSSVAWGGNAWCSCHPSETNQMDEGSQCLDDAKLSWLVFL